MALIELTQGHQAIVDDADFGWLRHWKWYAAVTGQNIKRVYAYRRADWDNANRKWCKCIYMHRNIMDHPEKGIDVDHINGNTLDNTRNNLRLASRSQNLANSRRPMNETGYRGVMIVAQCGTERLGSFATVEDAARAYDACAIKKFGEFAKLNFPNGGAVGLMTASSKG